MKQSRRTMSSVPLAVCLAASAAVTLAPGRAGAQERVVLYEAPVATAPRVAPATGPRIIEDWEEGEPVPAGYHPAHRTRRGMVVGGAVMFGTLYFISVLVAAGNSDAARKSGTKSEADALYIPAVGPFVQMTNSSSSTANVFLAMDGIAQSAGLAMLLYGITSPRSVLLRDASAKPPPFMLSPMAGRATSGLQLVGSF